MSPPKNLSRQQQVSEILKCGKDPVYFINTYLKIQTTEHGLVDFKTFDFQDNCIAEFEKHRLNIVLKARQLGLSTVTAAYALWMALFKKDKNILVIATKLPTAVNFIKKLRVMLENIPSWLLLTKFEITKQEIRFTNGSTVKAIPTSEDAGRSEALSLLIIDEAAWIRDFDEIWTGLKPTLSTGGAAIILSTPNGVGGQYYTLWVNAVSGANGFNPIKLMWDVHPDHDEEWFKKETANMSKMKAAQEYLCDFISSGDTFLQASDLEKVRDLIANPVEMTGPQNGVWIWRRPQHDKRYVLSADVARGDASDFSTFHIIDYETCEVVVEYMGKYPADKLADLLAEYGKKYNNALICPEQNGFGYFTCKRLLELRYPTLYYQNSMGDPFAFQQPAPDAVPGFSTQTKTRAQILTKLEELFRNGIVKSYSQRLYDQLLSFVWHGNKASAMKGFHDDLVMSLAIGTWICLGDSKSDQNGYDMAMAMLKATTRMSSSIHELPGGIDQVRPVFNAQQAMFTSENVHKPRRPEDVKHISVSDFSWLFR
jgi:hypothetical protein